MHKKMRGHKESGPALNQAVGLLILKKLADRGSRPSMAGFHRRHRRASPTPAQALQQALGINELPG
jgi:hypothetical protein